MPGTACHLSIRCRHSDVPSTSYRHSTGLSARAEGRTDMDNVYGFRTETSKKRFAAQQHTERCGFGRSGHTEQTSKMRATNACTYSTDNVQFYSLHNFQNSKQTVRGETHPSLLRPAQTLPRNTAICWVKPNALHQYRPSSTFLRSTSPANTAHP